MERLLSEKGLMVRKEARQEWDSSSCSLAYISLAQSAAWDFPLPLSIPCPLALLLLFVKSLGTDHADGCRIQAQPWLGAPRREGNPRKGRDWGWNRGAGQCALCLLSKGYHQLNLASGFQLEKGAGFRLHWASRGPRSPCPCTCLRAISHTPPSKP